MKLILYVVAVVVFCVFVKSVLQDLIGQHEDITIKLDSITALSRVPTHKP